VTDQLTCEAIDERGIIERYVSERLPEPEESAFEEHFFLCPRCQEALRVAMAVRGVVRAPGAVPLARRRVPRWAPVAAAAGVVLAAGLVALVARRPAVSSDAARDLGAVLVPPIYLGLPVRAAESPGDSLFERGMKAYVSQRFEEAADLLARAVSAGVAPAPAEFFRAASSLMLGRNAEAAAGFERVAAAGETPYLHEARYYRAKLLLRLGRAEDALRELRAAARGPSEVAGAANALADSVEARLRR